jgi:hypothetical protein
MKNKEIKVKTRFVHLNFSPGKRLKEKRIIYFVEQSILAKKFRKKEI